MHFPENANKSEKIGRDFQSRCPGLPQNRLGLPRNGSCSAIIIGKQPQKGYVCFLILLALVDIEHCHCL
jgi:hypothetical protein